jgi:hypothetical protein
MTEHWRLVFERVFLSALGFALILLGSVLAGNFLAKKNVEIVTVSEVEKVEKVEKVLSRESDCVRLAESFEDTVGLKASGYETATVENIDADQFTLVETCLTDEGRVQVYMDALWEFNLSGEYMWKVAVEQSSKNWRVFDIFDPLTPFLAPTCGVSDIISGGFYIDHVIVDCISGDGGVATKNGYLVDLTTQDTVSDLYACDLTPEVIVHPKTFETLSERHIETCDVLYL